MKTFCLVLKYFIFTAAFAAPSLRAQTTQPVAPPSGTPVAVPPAAAAPNDYVLCQAQCVALDVPGRALQVLGMLFGSSATDEFEAYQDLQEACRVRVMDRTCDYGAKESAELVTGIKYHRADENSSTRNSLSVTPNTWYYEPWYWGGGTSVHQGSSTSTRKEEFGFELTPASIEQVCARRPLAAGRVFQPIVRKRDRIYCGEEPALP